MWRKVVLLLLLAIMAVQVGCSKAEPPKAQKAADLAEEMEKQRREAEEAEHKRYAVKPVDFKRLCEMLPAGKEPYVRHDVGGQVETNAGEQTSKAWALYGKEPHQFRIDLIDFAGAKKKIDEAYWWTTRSVDQKLKSGYEKTGFVQQWYKSYERLNTEKKTSQYLVCAGERFIVSAEGGEDEMEHLKAAVHSMDFRKLADTK
ncbi:MAG: hypothetical protein KIS92_05260 [Planctomycetota bacterium]|nr:hypothetical protein [Planctomycetota bacterium]